MTCCCCFNVIIGISSSFFQKRRQMGLPVSDSVRAAICYCKLKDTRRKAQLLRRVPVVHTDSQMPSGIFVLKVACCSRELALGERIPFDGMKRSLHACLWRAPGRRDRGVGSGWEGGRRVARKGQHALKRSSEHLRRQ